MNDVELAALLAGGAGAPYPGTWQRAPFAERAVDGVRYALVALDPGLGALGLRRDDGALWSLPENGIPALVNSSAEAFAACARHYREAAVRVDAYEPPADDQAEDQADDPAEAQNGALTKGPTGRPNNFPDSGPAILPVNHSAFGPASGASPPTDTGTGHGAEHKRDHTTEQEADDDDADEAGELAADALTDELLARFEEIDPAAVADENSFWSIAAEELGYALPA
ncbi:SUKH-4 family immunity protein [Streptomyces sp. DSM 44915]|uniref:SUKH-4 family immunity protein n=1 Tax=Streptomyces chisholmiae TaxID=3075540 RepID=A0ABU2JYC7_9ACTN|nr:SUKH-4 family immunity protein [Streptomyces sp. DSM 44915]MDT0269995.1 SUKH-4 family immunity protein [Streptomyces sp. DSM 44915]